MLKSSAVFLITFNFWAALICCCQVSVCSPHEACSEQVMAEMDHAGQTQAQNHCGNQQNKASSKTQAQLKSCQCGNHQQVNPVGLLPNQESMVTQAPLIVVLTTWMTAKQVLTAERPNVEAMPSFLVSARFAPRLSALGRFLI